MRTFDRFMEHLTLMEESSLVIERFYHSKTQTKRSVQLLYHGWLEPKQISQQDLFADGSGAHS